MAIFFDEKAHEYYVDGVSVPSITECVKAAGLADYSAIPAHVLAKAAERGRAVHEALEKVDRGLRPGILADWLWEYEQAWQKIKASLDLEVMPEWIETLVYSQAHGYAGRLDRVFKRERRKVLVEIKITAKEQAKATGAQLAGQKIALEEMGVKVHELISLRYVKGAFRVDTPYKPIISDRLFLDGLKKAKELRGAL